MVDERLRAALERGDFTILPVSRNADLSDGRMVEPFLALEDRGHYIEIDPAAGDVKVFATHADLASGRHPLTHFRIDQAVGHQVNGSMFRPLMGQQEAADATVNYVLHNLSLPDVRNIMSRAEQAGAHR